MKKRKQSYKWIGFYMILCVMVLSGCGMTTVNTQKTPSSTVRNSDEQVSVQNERFALTFSYEGLGELFNNSWIPIHISVQNKGDDFKGKIKVSFPNISVGESKSIAYEKEIVVPKQEEQQVTIEIPQLENLWNFKVSIVKDETELIAKTVTIGNEYNRSTGVVVGILSHDTTNLKYIENQVLKSQNNQFTVELLQKKWNEQSFPTTLNSLGNMAFLVVDQIDTKQLSEEQIQTIIDWVKRGGTLIVGTGTNAQQVLSGFPKEFLSGTIGKQQKQTLLYGAEKEENQVEVDSVSLHFKNAELLTDVLDGTKLWKMERGEGNIIVAQFAFGTKAMKTWSKNHDVIHALLEKSLSDRIRMNMMRLYFGSYDADYMKLALNASDNVRFPKTGFYIFLFSIYVLCIGPVGYFVLKKKDCREKIWIFVPITACLFCGIIFLTSTQFRIKSPFATTITLMDVSEANWKGKAYVSITDPGKNTYQIQLSEQCQRVMPLDSYSYYRNENEIDSSVYAIEGKQNGTTISFEKSQAFSKYEFQMDVSEKKQQSGFQKNLKITKDTITGTVTNQTGYDLYEAGIIYDGRYIYLGTIKQEETVTIQQKNIELIRDSSTRAMEDVLTKHMPLDTQEERMRYNQIKQLYYAFSARFAYLQEMDGYVFGVTDQFDGNYITNSSIKESERVLLYECFTQENEAEDVYYVQNILKKLETNTTGNLNTIENCVYSDYDIATIKFDDDFIISELISSNQTTELPYKESELHVYAWNYRTKNFDEIFNKTKKLTSQQVKDYIKDNQMKLKFTCKDYVQLPIISAIGGEP